ncbi:hypothetical protein NPIL_656951 [Nephila pilipes]|uniref:Uncharacterized protein n=1 Tax=Nephila pilipes TaxID=299642 RepID=A0A8X6MZB1_NEPPI|nr:hypothetical protein NPIL_656951 [Nephila pilipes]
MFFLIKKKVQQFKTERSTNFEECLPIVQINNRDHLKRMLTLISSLANNSLGEFGVTVVKQLTKHPVTSDVTSCQRSSVLSKTTPNFTLGEKKNPTSFHLLTGSLRNHLPQ